MELTESKFLKHSEDEQSKIITDILNNLKTSVDDLQIQFNELIECNKKKEDINFPFMTIANIVTNYIDKENRTAWKYIRFYQMGQNRKQ